MMNIDLLGTAGNLYCYPYNSRPDVLTGESDKRLVNTGGWEQYSLVFAAGDNYIYAVDGHGDLYWYRHDGQQDGTARWEGRRKVVEGGWNQYVAVFAAGDNYIYTIDRGGDLYWYRHDGQQDGTERWTGRKLVSRQGWKQVVSVCAVGNIIYELANDGDLYWRRHEGQQDGTNRWSDRRKISSWNYEYRSIFAVGNNIYGLLDGNLYRHRHDGQQGGEELTDQGTLAGIDGFLKYRAVFAANNGTIYGVGVDTMSWMSTKPPSIYLNQFTIPGTHDTGTWTLDPTVAGFTNNAKCQSLTLAKQLNLSKLIPTTA